MSNAHLVTGYQGKGHITSEDVSYLLAGVFGEGKYVLPTSTKLTCELKNNKFYVYSGDMIFNGRHVRIENRVEIPYGEVPAEGMINSVIYARYERNINDGTGRESVNIYLKDNVNYPNPEEADLYFDRSILSGYRIVDFPLYHIKKYISSTEIIKVFDVLEIINKKNLPPFPEIPVPSSMTIALDTNQNYTVKGAVRETIPLKRVTSTTGDKLEAVELAAPIIGAMVKSGVRRVMVSGSVYFKSVDGARKKYLFACVYRNGKEVVGMSTEKYIYVHGDNEYIALPAKQFDVAENDVICLCFSGTSGDVVKSYEPGTFLTVQVIN